jgi:hypothetical protein
MPMTETLILDIVRWTVFIGIGIFLSYLIYRVLKLFLGEMAGSDSNRAMKEPDPHSNTGVWMETNWGGLGGGLSGWRVSNAIVYLLLITFLLGCLMLASVTLPPKSDEKNTSNTNKDEKHGRQAGDEKDSDPNVGKDKDANKANRKPGAAADDNQKKDADGKTDDPCSKKPAKPVKGNPTPAASGCSATPSPAPSNSPTPTATATPIQKPGQ